MKYLFLFLFIAVSGCATWKVPVDHSFTLSEQNKALHWVQGDLPLQIYIHPSAAMWAYHVQKAVDVWNTELGVPMFSVSLDIHEEAEAFAVDSPGIVPILGFTPPKDCTPPQCAPHTDMKYEQLTGKILAAPVYLPADPYLVLHPDAYLIVVHELGHTLGLEHDDTIPGRPPWSVMEDHLHIPVHGRSPPITDHDVQIVLNTYFPEIP